MSEHQPLLQIGTPLRETDPAYVILRLDDNQDVATAEVLMNQAAERLAPLAVGLADTVSRLLRSGVGDVTGKLQQAGLAPVLTQAPQQAGPYMAPEAAQSLGMQPYQAPQGQPLQTQVVPMQPNQPVYQPIPGQPTSSALMGPCWAASPRKMHNSECRDCGQPTFLTVKDLRSGKRCNAHVCTANPQHKITWCEETIWNSKVVTANGQGIVTDPNLVTG